MIIDMTENNENNENDIYTTINFKYSYESSVGEIEAERYIKKIHVDIVGRNEVDGEFLIGKAQRYILLLEQAIDDDYDIHDIFDFYSELYEFSALYDFQNDGFNDDLTEKFMIDELNLCIFSRLEIFPEYRGHGIGKMTIKDNFDMLSPGGGLVAMKPYPLQFEYRRNNDEEKEYYQSMGFDKLEQDKDKAFSSLKAYYRSLGYKTAKNYPSFMFFPTSQRNPRLDKIDINDDSAFRNLRKLR